MNDLAKTQIQTKLAQTPTEAAIERVAELLPIPEEAMVKLRCEIIGGRVFNITLKVIRTQANSPSVRELAVLEHAGRVLRLYPEASSLVYRAKSMPDGVEECMKIGHYPVSKGLFTLPADSAEVGPIED